MPHVAELKRKRAEERTESVPAMRLPLRADLAHIASLGAIRET